jgi:hypothetical protein
MTVEIAGVRAFRPLSPCPGPSTRSYVARSDVRRLEHWRLAIERLGDPT